MLSSMHETISMLTLFFSEVLSCVCLSGRLSLLLIASLWPQKEWYSDPSRSSGVHASRAPLPVETPRAASCQKVPSRSEDPLPSRAEVFQDIVKMTVFLRRVTEVVAKDLRGSTANLYQGKWLRFLYWCFGWNISPCKATVQQIVDFFLYLWGELKLSVPMVKSYLVVLNHIFSLIGFDLAANLIISRSFCSFERSCPPCEVSHQTGICSWFCGALLIILVIPVSCPLISYLI